MVVIYSIFSMHNYVLPLPRSIKFKMHILLLHLQKNIKNVFLIFTLSSPLFRVTKFNKNHIWAVSHSTVCPGNSITIKNYIFSVPLTFCLWHRLIFISTRCNLMNFKCVIRYFSFLPSYVKHGKLFFPGSVFYYLWQIVTRRVTEKLCF